MYQGPKLIPKPMLKQSLTPGLVQMVSILAMNKLELEEAIAQELLENPLLDEAQEDATTAEELAVAEAELKSNTNADAQTGESWGEAGAADGVQEGAGFDGLASASVGSPGSETESGGLESGSMEGAGTAGEGESAVGEAGPEASADPFSEIDFDSFFGEYLEGGSTSSENEDFERPSYENFVSAPTTLTDHLRWQLSVSATDERLREAAEAIIGNLDEDGYLTAEDDRGRRPLSLEEIANSEDLPLTCVHEALCMVQSFDPPGVAGRDLRECLLLQLRQLPVLHPLAIQIVSDHLPELQNKQHKEMARQMGVPLDDVEGALSVIQKLDPWPGRRYNRTQTRVIEPDIFFVKGRAQPCSICGQMDCENRYRVVTNDDGLPQLRLNRQYRAMKWDRSQRDVAHYIRDRYSSAIQFLRNLEQRKQTIARVCHVIIARQPECLDHGLDHLRPMMIKDVAEEIGVHPSTVSRAVSNKYAHTPQGVMELRTFFSEAVQGAQGADTSLVILKRRVKKMIEDEDPCHPLTDDAITDRLRAQGIDVTRRTVAKYREDMHIPSTHRRRRKG